MPTRAAAVRLGVSIFAVRQWIRSGRLAAVRGARGSFDIAELEVERFRREHQQPSGRVGFRPNLEELRRRGRLGGQVMAERGIDFRELGSRGGGMLLAKYGREHMVEMSK